MNRKVRIKLDHTDNSKGKQTLSRNIVTERDRKYKEKLKQNAENRNTIERAFKINDYVLLKQPKTNK